MSSGSSSAIGGGEADVLLDADALEKTEVILLCLAAPLFEAVFLGVALISSASH